jgi:hypothetical protein
MEVQKHHHKFHKSFFEKRKRIFSLVENSLSHKRHTQQAEGQAAGSTSTDKGRRN